MNNKAIALGTFDGIHAGHRQLIEKTTAIAAENGLEPMIYTFSNHPLEFFGKMPKRIMSDGERIEALERMAPVHAEAFDAKLASNEPEEFIRRMCRDFGMKAAVAGFNYTFGSRGAGTVAELRTFGKKYCFEVCEIPPLMYEGSPVSSTRIRACIASGQMADANAMLGREFSLSGKVVQNRRIGRRIGFPTANIPLEAGMVQPKAGVYAARVLLSGKLYPAVTNIGSNPTVNGRETTCETHIIGFDGDIYGERIKVCFVEKLRDDMTFASVGDLAAQIGCDVKNALNLL